MAYTSKCFTIYTIYVVVIAEVLELTQETGSGIRILALLRDIAQDNENSAILFSLSEYIFPVELGFQKKSQKELVGHSG